MSFVSVGVVLTGDSFPVQSIRVGDFKFRHRDLTETFRLPVALQAENDAVAMQVLPDRFEVNLKKPDRLDIQIQGLTELVDTFLEYVGKRTVLAVGHNFGWDLPGTAGRKSAVSERFLQASYLRTILDGDPIDPDLSVAFAFDDVVTARVQVNTSAPGDAGVTFNFHYDLSRTNLADALSGLSQSMDRATIIAGKIEDSLAEVRTA